MDDIFKKFSLKEFDTKKYLLTPIELQEFVSFVPRRIYFIQDFSGDTGAHCHYIEKELFVMIRGNAMASIDHGNGIEDVPFNKNDALYVPNYVWHGFKDIDKDAIILAISSTNYDANRTDYLEDYQAYLQLRDKHLR